MNYLGLALVDNFRRFLKCINYKQENCIQPCFIFQLEAQIGGLNFMKKPIITEKKS